jgi:hypothetical protein
MKKETIIWIIIAVVAIAMIVGGFFAFRSVLKKDDNGGNKGGSSNSGTNKGGTNKGGANKGGANNGGSQNNAGNDSGDNGDSGSTTIDLNVYAKATKLKDAIYGPGTDQKKLESVIAGVKSQEEWDEILAAYLEVAGESFKDDLMGEVVYNRYHKGNRTALAKPLTDKGIDSKFI